MRVKIESGHRPTLAPIGHTKLKQGHHYAGTPVLRNLLLAVGDLSPSRQIERADEMTLDPALVEDLKRYQRRHGLADHGVVGYLREVTLSISRHECVATPTFGGCRAA